MTFLTLARRNAWRKPMRTVLLVFCVAVAFLIYGLTASFLSGANGATAAQDDVLGVMSKAGRGQVLPIAYQRRIAVQEGLPPSPICPGCAASASRSATSW